MERLRECGSTTFRYNPILPVIRGVLLVVDLVALVEGVEEVVAVVNLPKRGGGGGGGRLDVRA